MQPKTSGFLAYVMGGLESNCFAVNLGGKMCLPVFDSLEKLNVFVSLIGNPKGTIAIECDIKKLEEILEETSVNWIIVNPDRLNEVTYVPSGSFIEAVKNQF